MSVPVPAFEVQKCRLRLESTLSKLQLSSFSMATSIASISSSFSAVVQEGVFQQSSVTQLNRDLIADSDSKHPLVPAVNAQFHSDTQGDSHHALLPPAVNAPFHSDAQGDSHHALFPSAVNAPFHSDAQDDSHHALVLSAVINAQFQSETQDDSHNALVAAVNAPHSGKDKANAPSARNNDASNFFDSAEEEDESDTYSENRGQYWCCCGKEFVSTSMLSSHKKQCTYDDKIGGYRCVCGATFKYLSDYSFHDCRTVARTADGKEVQQSQTAREVDSDTVSDNSGVPTVTKNGRKRKRKSDEEFACPVPGCKRKYKTQKFFNLHMQEKHPDNVLEPTNEPVVVVAHAGHDDEEEKVEVEVEDDDDDDEDYHDADLEDEPNGIIGQYITDQDISVEERAQVAIKLLKLAVGICDGEEKNRLAIRLVSICENFF